VISDGTQDKSKMEAQAVLVRYVETADGVVRPVERLIEVFTTAETSGEVLSNKILESLARVGLELQWLVGQSYDGASNVRGKQSGLQARIQEVAPKAMYVWCQAHRLNLVVESLLHGCTDICNTLGLLQELYNFFLGHKRHGVFMKLQAEESYKKTLKRVSDTTRSWRSAEDGVNTLLECFQAIKRALSELRDESTDKATVTSASGLYKRIHDFGVILCLFVLRSIFEVTGPVSRKLQSVATDLAVSTALIANCIDTFQQRRDSADVLWDSLVVKASTFATDNGIEPEFPATRIKMTKVIPGENAQDERIQDKRKAFKTTCFFSQLTRYRFNCRNDSLRRHGSL
jgi:hypothetical protein